MRTPTPWLLAAVLVLSPGAALADPADDAVQLSWRVDFGGSAAGPRIDHAFTLGLKAPGPAGPVEVPLYTRGPVLSQSEGSREATPWGNRQIIWWVVSGIGVVALIASVSSGGDDAPPAPAGTGGSS